MAYTNSSLVSYTKLSPNHSGQRTQGIDRITPHCVVGQCSVETLGNIFLPTSRQASCNYGIGVDGRVGMYVEEKNRSWCSSSSANDQRAVTIECASDTTEPYAFKDVVYQTLITLCTDICKRNGKSKLLWLGDSVFDNNGVNIYTPNTSTQAAPDVPFTVKVSISDLNIRKGPGADYAKTGKFTGKGVFTIVEVQSGQGSSAGWGRLKSGAGWISLDYAAKIK